MLVLHVRDRLLDDPKKVRLEVVGQCISNSTRIVNISFPLLLPDSSALFWIAARSIVDDAVEPFGHLVRHTPLALGVRPLVACEIRRQKMCVEGYNVSFT